jgi:hypothetical protein
MKKLLIATAILSMSFTGSFAQGSVKRTYECNGFSMTAEGDLICEYLDDYDKKTRHVFAGIEGDTVIYTIFREDPDNSLDMLKKWKLHIGIIAQGSPYFDVFHWMNGSEKIHKVSLPIVSGHKYIFQEFFCSRSTQPQLVSSTDKLDMSFKTEEGARAFYEKLKAIRATVETPGTGSASSSSSSSSGKLSGKVKVVNKTGGEVYIKVEGSGAMYKIQPNSGYDVQCSTYAGKKVFRTDKDQHVIGTLFTVDEGMCKKGEFVLGK